MNERKDQRHAGPISAAVLFRIAAGINYCGRSLGRKMASSQAVRVISAQLVYSPDVRNLLWAVLRFLREPRILALLSGKLCANSCHSGNSRFKYPEFSTFAAFLSYIAVYLVGRVPSLVTSGNSGRPTIVHARNACSRNPLPLPEVPTTMN